MRIMGYLMRENISGKRASNSVNDTSNCLVVINKLNFNLLYNKAYKTCYSLHSMLKR